MINGVLQYAPTIHLYFIQELSHESQYRVQRGHVLRIAMISTHTPYQGKTFGISYAPSTRQGADGGKCGGALPIVFHSLKHLATPDHALPTIFFNSLQLHRTLVVSFVCPIYMNWVSYRILYNPNCLSNLQVIRVFSPTGTF